MRADSVWREIGATWGLLTAAEVLSVLGLAEVDTATDLMAGGRLLSVQLGDVHLYPGFQFESGHVKPVIGDLVDLAHDVSWAHDDLVIWLCSPSGYFGGDRPVAHLQEPDELVQAARSAATVEW